MVGCLCLHGFTGSPWELAPLAEQLQAKYNWLVYTPVLPGHDAGEKLTHATYKEWIYKADAAARALLARCEKVYVIGFSMGGMLACYIAARYPVEKIVLLSAAAEYIGAGQLLKDMGVMIENGVKGTMKEHPWYPIFQEKIHTPLRAVREFQKAVSAVMPFLSHVDVPVFIGQGLKDGLVPKRSAISLYKRIKGSQKQLYFYEQSKHFICHGENKDQVIEDTERFLFSSDTPAVIVWKSKEEKRIKKKGERLMRVKPPKPFTYEGGKRAVLLLHAFTGSPADVRMLGRYLQKRGYTCHAPMYKGHGVPPEELMKTSYEEWWQDVEQAWQKLKNEGYEEIAVAGLSLGGAFTLKLAEEQDVKGIIPMCAPMITDGNKERLYKGVLQYAKQQKQLEGKSEKEINEEMEAFEDLPQDTLYSVNELAEDVRSLLGDIEAPAFIVQAGKDEMVKPESADVIYEEIGSGQKDLKVYEESHHVITVGPEKDQLHEDIYHFLEGLDWKVEKK